jgi:hypothetical protein
MAPIDADGADREYPAFLMGLPLVPALALAAVLLAVVPSVAQDASPSIDTSPSPALSVAAGVDVTAAEDESPEPVETSALAAEHRDLFLDMPTTIGGFEAEIVLVRGEEHFAQLPDNHPERVPLETLLVAAGAEVEDLTTGYALVSVDNLFSFVVGIRIDGAEPGSLLPAYLPFLLDDLVEPSSTPASLAGKQGLVITSIGADDELVELVVYDQGDTLWLLQGPTDTVEDVLGNLPER